MRCDAMYGPCEWQRVHTSVSLNVVSTLPSAATLPLELSCLLLISAGLSQYLSASFTPSRSRSAKFVGETMAVETGLIGSDPTSFAAKKQVPPFWRLWMSSSRLMNLVLSPVSNLPLPQRQAATTSTFGLAR